MTLDELKKLAGVGVYDTTKENISVTGTEKHVYNANTKYNLDPKIGLNYGFPVHT